MIIVPALTLPLLFEYDAKGGMRVVEKAMTVKNTQHLHDSKRFIALFM